MNYSSHPEKSINALDFCVDFSKNELSRFLDQHSGNQQLTPPLTIEVINSLLEDSKKLKNELKNNLKEYKRDYTPKIERLQEKNQANQKIKKQTLPNNLVQPIRSQNPPNNPSNPGVPKDRSSQRNHEPLILQSPPPKIEKPPNNQTNAQTRHHDKKNVSKSTGGEKPTRQSENKINKSSVWYKAEPFFQKLPSKEEFTKVFSMIDEIIEKRKVNANNLNDGNVEHWSERMNRYVRPGKKMLKIPTAPSDPNDISDFWKNVQIPFQVEAMQKRSFSSFHYLINSFIELDSIPPAHSNSPISSPTQDDQLQTRENENHSKDREPNPITSFSLLPQIVSETYMALSFDQRLSLELESLGLNLPSGSVIKRMSPIESEIKTKIKENNKIISTLLEMREDIMNNIDKYRLEQQKRNEMIEESQNILATKLPNKQSK